MRENHKGLQVTGPVFFVAEKRPQQLRMSCCGFFAVAASLRIPPFRKDCPGSHGPRPTEYFVYDRPR